MIRLDDRLTPTRAPLTPPRLRAVARALRAGGPALARLSVDERIAALDRVAASWLAAGSVWRRRALADLSISTGHPHGTIDVALANLWNALRAPHLSSVYEQERAGHETLPLPGLALHVLAGNVPGVGIFGVVAALLAGVPSLVKPATREPFLPGIVVESINAVAPELGRAVAVSPWRGGTADLDTVAVDEADLVLAYGRDETLDRLALRHPRRFVRYGERLSVALVAGGARTPATAAALARQVALYDQQGCLSPQIACVEDAGSAADTDRFAALVAAELAELEQRMPRATPTLAESASTWRFVERQRWLQQEGEAVTVHGGLGGAGSVVVVRDETWPMSPTFRHLVLLPIPAIREASAALRHVTGTVEAVGYAGPASGLGDAAAVATAVGAPRLCPLERLQAPPFAWRQSGHARLGSIVGHDGSDVVPAYA